MNSVVWTLIDNGKLANQNARLVGIVVKNAHISFFHNFLTLQRRSMVMQLFFNSLENEPVSISHQGVYTTVETNRLVQI